MPSVFRASVNHIRTAAQGARNASTGNAMRARAEHRPAPARLSQLRLKKSSRIGVSFCQLMNSEWPCPAAVRPD